jgi:acyl-CoA hydrolase
VFVPVRDPGPLDYEIAEQVASLVPDGAVLQLGVGSVISAIAEQLADRKDLGVHSGMLGDWIVDMTEAGAITNARKPIDVGVSVSGTIFGTRRLYDFVHENPAIGLRPLRYTHDNAVLRSLGNVFSINSAVEVDLTGQVNSETMGGHHVGTVGGQVDFVRGAVASEHGRSIIALPAAAKGGEITRIVSRLADGVVTTARSDVDVIITEHGIAELRGVGIHERARRLAAIAAPQFREQLLHQARELC